jgi:hypothetical protein
MEVHRVKSIAGKALFESTILSCAFLSWLISFLCIYLPTSGFIKQTLLSNFNFQQKLTFFLISTALASSSFLIKGIQLLRKPKQEEKISTEEAVETPEKKGKMREISPL